MSKVPPYTREKNSCIVDRNQHGQRDWYLIAERPAPAPHLAHPEGCAALRIVLVTVPRVSRFCEHFPDEFGHHALPSGKAYNLISERVLGNCFGSNEMYHTNSLLVSAVSYDALTKATRQARHAQSLSGRITDLKGRSLI